MAVFDEVLDGRFYDIINDTHVEQVLLNSSALGEICHLSSTLTLTPYVPQDSSKKMKDRAIFDEVLDDRFHMLL